MKPWNLHLLSASKKKSAGSLNCGHYPLLMLVQQSLLINHLHLGFYHFHSLEFVMKTAHSF